MKYFEYWRARKVGKSVEIPGSTSAAFIETRPARPDRLTGPQQPPGDVLISTEGRSTKVQCGQGTSAAYIEREGVLGRWWNVKESSVGGGMS